MINTLVQIEHVSDFQEQGFYSKSYLATDTRLKRPVAVKDIIYENLTSTDDFEKYFDEALKLSIATHPRILPIYYVGIDHGNNREIIPRIVTCYFKNGSLNNYLQKVYSEGKTLNLDEVIRFSHDIIQGMIHLHSLDIVHLDLKASNVYIGDDFKLVLGDFGQAKFIVNGIIHEPSNLYPAIAPLEAATKRAIDKTTDIYQFGLLLYSMLCYDIYRESIENKYKISTENLKKIYREKPENVEELKSEFKSNMKAFHKDIKDSKFPNRIDYPYIVPEKIQEIIKKCLDPDIANRYNNFYQIQSDLNEYIFPNGVSELYQDLDSKEIRFVKDEKPCTINVSEIGSKFDIIAKKNGRNVTGFHKNNVTQAKFKKVLYTFVSTI